jgi:hypothetical protein
MNANAMDLAAHTPQDDACGTTPAQHQTRPTMNDPNKRPDKPNSTPSSEGKGPTPPDKPVDQDREDKLQDALDSYLNSIFEGREDYVPKSRRREDDSTGRSAE